MGLIDGLIIGGAIGGVVGGVMAYRMKRWKLTFSQALATQGPQKARSVLDKHAGPVPRGKFPLNKLSSQRARFAGLAILDQVDELGDELEWHEGGPAFKMGVRGFGLVCLAVRASDPAKYVETMDALVAEVEAEAGSLQKLIKDKARMLGQLMHGMAGDAISPADRSRILKWGSKDGSLEKAIMYYAVVRADALAGVRDEPLVRNLRELTDVFALQDG